MTMARKAELQPERGKIMVGAKQIERPRQPQALLVAVKRHCLDLLKDLGEIDR